MDPPLFVLDGDDIEVFDSLEALARYVEPVDAVHARLLVFDSRGRRLDVSGEDVKSDGVIVGGGKTVAERFHPPIFDPMALTAALRGFIGRVGSERIGVTDQWLQVAPLDSLVEAVADFLGFS